MKSGKAGRPDRPAPERARGKGREGAGGERRTDESRTPGDGTLDGAMPAGLPAEELRRRAEDPDSSEPGTG